MGLIYAYHVVDCPEHAQSALVCPSNRRFCFACGREVAIDPLGAAYCVEASDDLKAEARNAWNGSQVIRDFAAGVQPGTRPLTTRVAS